MPELQSQINALNAKATLAPEDTGQPGQPEQQLADSRTRLAQAGPADSSSNPGDNRRPQPGPAARHSPRQQRLQLSSFSDFRVTIVLGIIFVSSVYNNLSMPEFSTTLLGLMGISSGTYIGFKFPEKK